MYVYYTFQWIHLQNLMQFIVKVNSYRIYILTWPNFSGWED